MTGDRGDRGGRDRGDRDQGNGNGAWDWVRRAFEG